MPPIFNLRSVLVWIHSNCPIFAPPYLPPFLFNSSLLWQLAPILSSSLTFLHNTFSSRCFSYCYCVRQRHLLAVWNLRASFFHQKWGFQNSWYGNLFLSPQEMSCLLLRTYKGKKKIRKLKPTIRQLYINGPCNVISGWGPVLSTPIMMSTIGPALSHGACMFIVKQHARLTSSMACTLQSSGSSLLHPQKPPDSLLRSSGPLTPFLYWSWYISLHCRWSPLCLCFLFLAWVFLTDYSLLSFPTSPISM